MRSLCAMATRRCRPRHGTFASRSIVMSGGAVAKSCRLLKEKIVRIAAHALHCKPEEIALPIARRTGRTARSPSPTLLASRTCARSSFRAAWSRSRSDRHLRAAVDKGVSPTRPRPPWWRSIRTPARSRFSTTRWVEDCGTVVNPLIVDGQIVGGIRAGHRHALYEESTFNGAASRSPRRSATTLRARPRSRRSRSAI